MTPTPTTADAATQLLHRHAVTDVMASYASSVDRRDWVGVRSCFDPAAHIRGTRMTADFADYFPRFCAELEKFERTVHFLGTQRVQLSAGKAWLETYAVARHFWRETDGDPRQMTIGVRYADDLRYVDGRWLIVRREVDLDWSDTSPPGADLSWSVFGAGATTQPGGVR